MRRFLVELYTGKLKMCLADYMHVDINGILRLYCKNGDDDVIVFTSSRDKFNYCEDRGPAPE